MMSEKVKRSELLATEYHLDQKRKHDFEPYINHPRRVYETLLTIPHTESMLCAAWLHDLLEDTTCPLSKIEALDSTVAILVTELTNVRDSSLSRKERKIADRMRLARASTRSKTIKLADMLDNIPSIITHDPEFAKVYLAEQRSLLFVLTGGNKELWDKVDRIIEDYFLITG